MVVEISFDSAMQRLKKVVYKQRVRVKDFIVDFDKLNAGYVHPNHFLTALNMAQLHKHLSASELELICAQYKVQRDASLVMVDYRSFLHELELVFTVPVGVLHVAGNTYIYTWLCTQACVLTLSAPHRCEETICAEWVLTHKKRGACSPAQSTPLSGC